MEDVIKKIEYKGWLGGEGRNLGFYSSKEDAEGGINPGLTLSEALEDFKGKYIILMVEKI